ncbi:uncharacterized protein LOC130152333 [Falco biarmicus]|uniref:uncharacterized protein LOC129736461 n=1 Tax=Falco cherrug TaxID=345164 RepID=UPI00247AC58E|nr:uncharacterized protein LOC129736461 [Falco cherrug]XP_056201698.1 uncharacterized protein LOC130152333 [Falco biarmicus]
MFPRLPIQLPSVEWGFLIAFCLSVCLFGCLDFFASVRMLVLPVAETAGPFSELDVCTFSYRLSNEKKKKIYFLLIYYNGTKTTKLQTYEAFLLEFSVVGVVKETGDMSFQIICFALESSLCPQTVVMHRLVYDDKSSWDIGPNRLWLTTEITCSCLEYTMFIEINIQCKFLILFFLSLVSSVSVAMSWHLLGTHTSLSTASERKVHSSLLTSKGRDQGAKPPLCAFAGQSVQTTVHFTACPVTLAGCEAGRWEGKEMGAGKGVSQGADTSKGCIWGSQRWGTISRLNQKSCSLAHKTFSSLNRVNTE